MFLCYLRLVNSSDFKLGLVQKYQNIWQFCFNKSTVWNLNIYIYIIYKIFVKILYVIYPLLELVFQYLTDGHYIMIPSFRG